MIHGKTKSLGCLYFHSALVNFLWKTWQSDKVPDNVWKWQPSKILARHGEFHPLFTRGGKVFVRPISSSLGSHHSHATGKTVFQTWVSITALLPACFSCARWIVSEVRSFRYLHSSFHWYLCNISWDKDALLASSNREGELQTILWTTEEGDKRCFN